MRCIVMTGLDFPVAVVVETKAAVAAAVVQGIAAIAKDGMTRHAVMRLGTMAQR